MWESGQVLCFCHCLHAQIICYLHWEQHAGFVFCILFCFNVFSKQNCYNHNNALYGWHTWWRRCLNDFWLVASTKISFAPKILLSASEPDKFSTCIMHATDNYMQTMTCKQTNWQSSSFCFLYTKLSSVFSSGPLYTLFDFLSQPSNMHVRLQINNIVRKANNLSTCHELLGCSVEVWCLRKQQGREEGICVTPIKSVGKGGILRTTLVGLKNANTWNWFLNQMKGALYTQHIANPKDGILVHVALCHCRSQGFQ